MEVGTTGYTEEEKIKILYEESLKDIRELSTRLGEISKEVNKSAIAARGTDKLAWSVLNEAFANKMLRFGTAALVASAVLFGGTGYLLRFASDQVNLNTAREKVIEANERANAAAAALAAVSADSAKTLEAEIQKNTIASGWSGTPTGRLAKKFFDLGGGEVAATCTAETWDIVRIKEGKWCVPKRRDLIGGENQKYGWKIP